MRISIPRENQPDVQIEKWYHLRNEAERSDGFRNGEDFRELLSNSVALRLRSDVPVGVCLSGGLDSSSLVSILLKDFKKKDLHTFSAVYGKGRPGDERNFIDVYSDQLRNMHFITPTSKTFLEDLDTFLRIHGEPVPSTAPYAQYKVMELARNHVVVTLDGQGADEMLAGYHYFFGYFFKDLLKHRQWTKLLSEMVQYFRKHRSIYGFQTFAYFLLPNTMKTGVRILEKKYLQKDFIRKYKDTNTITSGLYNASGLREALLDHFEYKMEHLLKWEDRNSMWFSLEARVPFLDHRLVEKTIALENHQCIHHGMTKHILREAMKSTLPEPILNRKDKVGFDTPQGDWLRTAGFQKIFREVVRSSGFLKHQIFRSVELERMHDSYLAGDVSLAQDIWKVINLGMWFDRFIG